MDSGLRLTLILLTLSLLPLTAISVIMAVHTNVSYRSSIDETRGREEELGRSGMTNLLQTDAATLDSRLGGFSDIIHGFSVSAERIYRGEVDMPEYGDILLPWNGTGYPDPGDVPELRDEIVLASKVGTVLESVSIHQIGATLIYFSTPGGVIVTSGGDTVIDFIANTSGFDPRSREWFIRSLDSDGVVWVEPYIDANTKHLVVTCSLAVRVDGEHIGTLGLDLTLDVLLQGGNRGNMLIFDTRGSIISSRGDGAGGWWGFLAESGNLTDMGGPGMRMDEAFEAHDTGILDLTVKGTKVLLAHSRMNSTGWVYCVVEDRERAIDREASNRLDERRSALLERTLIIWVVFATFLSAISVSLGQSMSRRVKKLADSAEAALENEGEDIVEIGGADSDLSRIRTSLDRMNRRARTASYLLDRDKK